MFYSAVKSPPQMQLFLCECWLMALTQHDMVHKCTHGAPEWVSTRFTALGIKSICSDPVLSEIIFWLNRYFWCISPRYYFILNFSHLASINIKSKTILFYQNSRALGKVTRTHSQLRSLTRRLQILILCALSGLVNLGQLQMGRGGTAWHSLVWQQATLWDDKRCACELLQI